jgi:hypothetical protein
MSDLPLTVLMPLECGVTVVEELVTERRYQY